MSIDVLDSSNTGLTEVDGLIRQAEFLMDQLNLDPECDLSIALVDEAEMTRLHVEWMDLPGPTDVLSFPMDDLRPGQPGAVRPLGSLGDVILCPVVAQRQAQEAGHGVRAEIELLLTHGILHLLGYDHVEPDEHERMFALQGQLLDRWRQEGDS